MGLLAIVLIERRRGAAIRHPSRARHAARGERFVSGRDQHGSNS